MISKKDIFKWLAGHYKVEQYRKDELKFPCPYCGYANFYFNIAKQVGFCHRAKCHRKPTMVDMINLIGYPPSLAGYVPEIDNAVETGSLTKEITLPSGCVPLSIRNDDWVISCLLQRGISLDQALAADIHTNKYMIVIPVYWGGKMVQYVGRFIDRAYPPSRGFRKVGRRYDYFPGAPITNYLYNWGKTRKYTYLTLVENTFNAIWLGGDSVTTNFGSFLSDTQANLINKSAVKQVLFLWDEGANAKDAILKLKLRGVRADYYPLKGQPDDHNYSYIQDLIIPQCHIRISENIPAFQKVASQAHLTYMK